MNKKQNESDVSGLTFPCDLTVKAIGKATDSFEISFLNIIKKYFPEVKENAISQHMSESNQYLALSVTVHTKNRKQMDALYSDLTNETEILIAL